MDCILERLAKAIMTQLATISVANGYGHTPKSVSRLTMALVEVGSVEDTEIYLCQEPETESLSPMGEEREIAERDENSPMRCLRQTFSIACFVRPKKGDATPIDTYTNNRVADVEKCIAAADPTWGGLAMGTFIRPQVRFIPSEEGYFGGYCVIDIDYTVGRFNPFSTGANE